jgi:hypothetical protein
MEINKEKYMKIRNGFVSNSSSSSFMLITSKDNLKDICSEFNEQLKNIKHPTVKLASNLLSSIYTNADEIKDEQSLLKHFYCGTIEDLKDINCYNCKKVYSIKQRLQALSTIIYMIKYNEGCLSSVRDKLRKTDLDSWEENLAVYRVYQKTNRKS